MLWLSAMDMMNNSGLDAPGNWAKMNASLINPTPLLPRLVNHGKELPFKARDRTSGKTATDSKQSVLYLAVGVIPTTKLLLESRQCYDHTVWIKDSQYFLIPLPAFQRRARCPA